MKERGANTRARRGLGEDWVLNHVGMTVSNRNATLQHFQSLGVGVSVGPQPLLPYEEGEGSLMFYQCLDGDPITRTYPTGGVHHFTDGECQIGNCQLECYPMRPGPGMFLSEYLSKKGPGINHICFNAPDVEEDTKWLIDKGCAIMFNALVNGRTVENYLDSRRVGDIMISLRPPASDWEKEWKKNNESHPLVNEWEFIGVDIAVSSVEDAVGYYESLGFIKARDVHDDVPLGMRSQAIEVGPIIFNFVEPIEKDAICAESLGRRGEGVFSISFRVTDLEAEKQRLKERGLAVHLKGTSEGVAYLDTSSEGNVFTQLVQA